MPFLKGRPIIVSGSAIRPNPEELFEERRLEQ
jgi:hypothetical protein